MIGKKRSVGVTVFGYFFLLFAILHWGTTRKYEPLGYSWVLYARITAILSVVLSIKVLQLKEWARRGIIYFYVITSLVAIVSVPKILETRIMQDSEIAGMKIYEIAAILLIVSLWSAIIIFFFTRPKVKEQFR